MRSLAVLAIVLTNATAGAAAAQSPAPLPQRLNLGPSLSSMDDLGEVTVRMPSTIGADSLLGFSTRAFHLDLAPHADVTDSRFGRSTEAGAVLRLSKPDQTTQALRAFGVRDGSAFGQQGRWYVFAAASGRSVGLNMLHRDNSWDHAGWTTDPTSALVGDAQVGVGWRKGGLQTSLGYVHREVKGQHMLWGQDTRTDSMVALSLSIKPRF